MKKKSELAPDTDGPARPLTDRLLGATIYESLHRMPIHLDRNTTDSQNRPRCRARGNKYALKHRDPPKGLRRVLQCVLQVLHYCLLPDRLFDAPLCLNIVWVCVRVKLCRVRLPCARCAEEGGEACGIGLCSGRDVRVCLWERPGESSQMLDGRGWRMGR